jgi:hypothetical protein
MRWLKIIGLIALGGVLGGLFSGYVVFEYMERFGIAWNQWVSSQRDEETATATLVKVKGLTALHAGNTDEARRVLEWSLLTDIPNLASMKKMGRDPDGYTSKAILAARDYRVANPWSSGDPELDKATSDTLNKAATSARLAH